MHKRTLIKNAVLVNEGEVYEGALLIQNHHIEQVLRGCDAMPTQPADQVIDAQGAYLLPGVIDSHVHLREPGYTHKGDMRTETAAAAAGGVTTVLDMPNTVPQTLTLEALEEKMALAREKSLVNYGFYIGASNTNAEELAKINPRHVCGIKVFMGSSTGNMLVDQEEALRKVFSLHTLPIVTHCEDSVTIAENMQAAKAAYGDDPEVAQHSEIRSAEACYRSTALAVKMARECGTRLHVAHISTAKELELFSAEDKHITAEVCLPHLVFTTADYARLGTRIKCNPAVKSATDRDALRTALNGDIITTVGTDHAPHLLSEKVGGAARAVSGMPMVQFSLPAMLGLVDEGVLSIARLVQLMCHNPAETFQIENRGYLREGYKADLVVVRPDSPWTLTPNQIESKCNWSPLEGRVFRHRVEKTFVNGYLLYNNGHITDYDHTGEAVTYDR